MKKAFSCANTGLRALSGALGRVGMSPVSFAAFVMLALIPVIFSNNEYIIRLSVSCLIFGTLAMGFDLSAGFIGVPNWGYASLMGLGCYTSALLQSNFGITPWIGMIVSGFAATLIGFLIAFLTLRMDGVFAALLSWFVGIILMTVIAAMPQITRGAMGLRVEPLFETPWATPYFYVIFGICIIAFMCLKLITKSHLGLAFLTLGQDMEAARTSGISPLRYRTINFIISCFIGGVVGGFYAHFVCILTPNVLSTKNTVQVLVLAYIGGRGSIWGPLLAAFIILPIFESMNSLLELKYIIYGVLLILVMIFFPGGLSSLLRKAKDFCVQKIGPLLGQR